MDKAPSVVAAVHHLPIAQGQGAELTPSARVLTNQGLQFPVKC